MPPFLPRKRLRSPTPDAGPSTPATSKGKAKAASANPRKPSLFDDLDTGTGRQRTAADKKALLETLTASTGDESSLSSLSDGEFEDVPAAKRRKTSNNREDDDEDGDGDEDEDIEFEDVATHAIPTHFAPPPSGDLELTLTKETRVDITNPFGTKKGPSKIERQIRISTHQIHVQMLMYHNAIRNSWLCDKELQDILVKQLPPGVEQQVEKWRRDSGLQTKTDNVPKGKGKGKATSHNSVKVNSRSQRDWGQPAERLAQGQVNISHGDPLFRLMKILVNYWRQRFRITAPGLRKIGYMSLQRLDEESKSFKEDPHDHERHGELIRDIEEFKECAKALEGSRDVGAQLFTALLRGLGLEARLVASLQPIGFGWSQNEEASAKNPRALKRTRDRSSIDVSPEVSDSEEENINAKAMKEGKAKVLPKHKDKATSQSSKSIRTKRSAKGFKDIPIDLSESEEAAAYDSGNESVIDVTPGKPRTQHSLPYDKDLVFPHYWTEVLSPVTNTFTAVDAVVLRLVATNKETLEKFETRGTKSEKAKQVTAYIIGHSADGTAKDVTTRYLKRHIWPGRTKGCRFPIEKVPIYNQHGKIKRYEQKDWFKTVMSGYARGSKKCPRTEIDDHEEATDLKPMKAEKKEIEEGKETLQYYKSSQEFVLERHLKREEPLVPTAQHVKMFTVKGKGEDSTEEKVFRRRDVVNCKSMETWHKEGRAPKPGEEPLKRVPYRAATTNRRRELAEAEHASGEKVLQGLFSHAQTDWIIPPPIENGIIPKNAFGNIDLYVDSMLPGGAVHLPYRGMVKLCKRLNIDFAEAVTGFEFGHRMAVPIITGVVVAEEHYDTIMDEWEKDETERVRKEDEKRKKVAIHMWRKMLMGMRIIERVREEYGDLAEGEIDVLNPWTNTQAKEDQQAVEAQKRIMDQRDEDMAGGFLPEGYEIEEPQQSRPASFYPVAHEDEGDDEGGGGFVVEGQDEPTKAKASDSNATLQSVYPDKTSIDTDEPRDKPIIPRTTPQVEVLAKKNQEKASPSTKKNATPKSLISTKTKAKTPAKRSAKAIVGGKRKLEIQATDDEDEDDISLAKSQSDPESDGAVDLPRKPLQNNSARNPAILPKAAGPSNRRTPKRNAARKSETALRSHYFEHNDEGDEEDN